MYLITWLTTHLPTPDMDGWLSWPCWLTNSRWLNNKVVTHPASSLAQDRESSPAETSILTTMLRRQLATYVATPFHTRLMVRLGTDNRQTDRQRPSMHYAQTLRSRDITWQTSVTYMKSANANAVRGWHICLHCLHFTAKAHNTEVFGRHNWHNECRSEICTQLWQNSILIPELMLLCCILHSLVADLFHYSSSIQRQLDQRCHRKS